MPQRWPRWISSTTHPAASAACSAASMSFLGCRRRPGTRQGYGPRIMSTGRSAFRHPANQCSDASGGTATSATRPRQARRKAPGRGPSPQPEFSAASARRGQRSARAAQRSGSDRPDGPGSARRSAPGLSQLSRRRRARPAPDHRRACAAGPLSWLRNVSTMIARQFQKLPRPPIIRPRRPPRLRGYLRADPPVMGATTRHARLGAASRELFAVPKRLANSFTKVGGGVAFPVAMRHRFATGRGVRPACP